MPEKYHFEDFEAGQMFDLGAVQVEKDDIIAFASEFDPQPFHLDEAAGKASLLGGLAASGWHTGAMVMRLLANGLLNGSTCQGSPGIDRLKWQRPVFPGDTISAQAEVLKTKILKSRPALGLVTVRLTATNQAGVPVLVSENPILFGTRGGQ